MGLRKGGNGAGRGWESAENWQLIACGAAMLQFHLLTATTPPHTQHKTLTQNAKKNRSTDCTHVQLPVLRRIAAEEGAGALWRGIGPRVLFHAPSAAVCWGTYETMKTLLQA